MIVYCDAKECVHCQDYKCDLEILRMYDGSCGRYEEEENHAQAENAGKATGDLR